MPRFAANVTTMFTELPVAERFSAARETGFNAVEFLKPYDWPVTLIRQWLSDNKLELLLINSQSGLEGEAGIAALPYREDEFRTGFMQSMHYAVELGASMIHLLAGKSAGKNQVSESVFLRNLEWAAGIAAENSIQINLEPLNTVDVPGYLNTNSDYTAELITLVGAPNIAMQFDLYHMQVMEGHLAASIQKHLDIIGHIQFSSLPGRHEPQYGEVNLTYLFDWLDKAGYKGWVGCEYWAKEDTRSGLIWAKPYGLG